VNTILQKVDGTNTSADSNTLNKSMLILAFLFITFVAYILARTPQARGYELNIYAAYPIYFWAALVASMLLGYYSLISSAFQKHYTDLYKIALIAILITNFIVITLPVYRNYYLSDIADEVNHLGAVNTIDMSARLANQDFYPIAHIFSFEISKVTNIDSRIVVNDLTLPAYYLIYILGLYVLAKKVSRNKKQLMLILSFGSMLLFTWFNVYYLPTQFFLFAIPMILYLFFCKSKSLKYTLLFILAIAQLPFMHPLGAIFLIVIFMIYELSILIKSRLERRWLTVATDVSPIRGGIGINATLLTFIVWFVWFSVFVFFKYAVTVFYNGLVLGIGETPVANIADLLQRGNLSLFDFGHLVIINYGHDLIVSLITLVSILIFLYRSKKNREVNLYMLFFQIFFVTFTAIYLATLIGKFSVTGFSIRIYCWALFATVLINGYMMFDLVEQMKGRAYVISKTFLMACIMIAATLGIFNTYPSPIISQPNLEVTRMDWTATVWFFKNKASYQTIDFDNFIYNALNGIYGYSIPIPRNIGRFTLVPAHLGLSGDKLLTQNSYIVLYQRVKEDKQVLFPDVGNFTIEDLNRLDSNRKIDQIYSNNETEIYEFTV
jgi:hypothetical protein